MIEFLHNVPIPQEKAWSCGCRESRRVWRNPGSSPDIETVLFKCEGDQCMRFREKPRYIPTIETIRRIRSER